MNYATKLQDIGLKKQEAEVYLACLKLGMAKVSELAKEVDIPRTSIYVYLGDLLEKGYLKKSKKQGIEYFIPLEPKFILEDKKEKIKNFSETLPQLEKILGFSGKKPKIEYFDTKQGLLKIYEAMLRFNYKHIPCIIESGEATKQNLDKLGWEFWYKWEKKFLDKKVATQGIITKDVIPLIKSAPEKIKKILYQRPATVRVIDQNDFFFSINLYLIYPRNAFIVVPQQNFVLIIEDENIYKSLLTLYKALFEQGERLSIQDIL